MQSILCSRDWRRLLPILHHAEILSLKGDSYRLRDKEIATRPRPALIDDS